MLPTLLASHSLTYRFVAVSTLRLHFQHVALRSTSRIVRFVALSRSTESSARKPSSKTLAESLSGRKLTGCSPGALSAYGSVLVQTFLLVKV
jgi:hypothetical protein